MNERLEVSPAEARERLAEEERPAVLLDVREPEEYAVSRIEGARLMPMQSIPAQLQTLERLADNQDLLVLCHHGVRSLQVVSWLRANGVENSFSIGGGIDRWSREVDETIPRY